MRYQILHETRYLYDHPVHGVAMEARLQPCNDDSQTRQRYRLSVTPKAPLEEYSAFSDLLVQCWTVLKASEIRIVSESIVDIRPRPLQAPPAPPPELDTIELYPYLHETPLTVITPNIRQFADQFAALASEDWYQAVLAAREAIYAAITFENGQTTTDTAASEVLTGGVGVCQDFTHLMLATVRALGIPARYVSGYLNQYIGPAPRQKQEMGSGFMSQEQSMGELPEQVYISPTLRGTGASHAWCEVYLSPELGWRGFDAANNLLIDQNYIRIGAGRDFRDITPVKGVHRGPAEEDLKVTVNVTKLG